MLEIGKVTPYRRFRFELSSTIKNWKFKYLEHIETPAELPAIISAARSQQFRWNKGGAEKLVRLPLVFYNRIIGSNQSPRYSALIEQFDVPSTFTMAILSIPVLFIRHEYPSLKHF
jgi:hypothetical protein